ncbi:MAG: glycosyltransferase family 4 protein [Planctomycetes bacterium]|nr:glycosyltransferase family 4 protein [Planctomycetota bacterium]MBU1518763.1 glycosyltransferase family 4 protein [Planctomycetota bacterium]MBU2596153.1 glycosyltransferase family 4 protein [Planctomycetota bacterium]
MKIVHIITRLILGGAQENTLISCKQLAARGHDVTLITGPAFGPEGELFEQTKNQKYKTTVVNSLRRQINPIYDIPAYYQLKKVLTEIQPDIVHTHSAKAGILGRFAAAQLKTKNSKLKTVHSVHGLSFHKYQNKLLNKFYIAVEKTTAKKTDAFVCVADAMTQKSLAVGIGKAEQYTTAYSAIEEEQFLNPISPQQRNDFRKKYDIPDSAIVLVTIARLFHLKGHNYIIESADQLAKRFENCIWLFVGDGILRYRLQNQIAELGLTDKFRFTGLLPVEQMPLVIQSSDILVHCSLREGLARVLPQAMLCSKPAISFDIDGANEVVNPDTGRLVEPENVEQLTETCAELIANENLRTKLGLNGREFVKEKFSPKTMVDKIEQIYKGLL